MFGRSPELIAAKVKIEFLTKENENLRQQVFQLQDALVASRAPEAYAQRLADRYESKEPEKNLLHNDIDLMKRMLMEFEGKPAFENAEEFIKYVKKLDPGLESNLEMQLTEAPEPPISLHDNEES